MLPSLLVAALLAAQGPAVLVLKSGARLEVSSYEVQGKVVRIVGSEGDLLVLKTELVDWKMTQPAAEAESEDGAEQAPSAKAPAAREDKKTEARQPAGRPQLLFFTARWCGYCRKMKSTTMADDEVKKALERYTLTYVDIDDQPALADKYAVRGVPSFVTLAGDKVLKRASGYQPAAQFVAWLKP